MPRPEPTADDGPELDPIGADDGPAAEPARGRGAPSRKPARAAKRAKARTVYLDDQLWERVIVQSHRRGLNYSDYVGWALARVVPDHLAPASRGQRAEPAEGQGEAA